MRRIGDAKGLLAFYKFPKYWFIHKMSIDGHSKGSVTALILEGLNFTLKSSAGYAKYIPLGGGSLYNNIFPINEHARFPPADYPIR